MLNVRLISFDDRPAGEILSDYISPELDAGMNIIFDGFNANCDICRNDKDFKRSLVSFSEANDVVLVLGGITKNASISAKEIIAKGLGLELIQNQEMEEKNKALSQELGQSYSEDMKYFSSVPQGAKPILTDDSFAYGYLLELDGKFLIHLGDDKNEVRKCLGVVCLPYLYENINNSAVVSEITVENISREKMEAPPFRSDEDTHFSLYRIGDELRGRIIVNKGSNKKSEKAMDKLFPKAQSWARQTEFSSESPKNSKPKNKKSSKSKGKSNKLVPILISAIIIVALAVFGIFALGGRDDFASLYPSTTTKIPSDFPADYQKEFVDLYSKNSEVAGFVEVLGGEFRAPISKHTDNDFYKSRSFSGKDKAGGSLYADYRNNLETDDIIVIYGDGKENGAFARLGDYMSLDSYSNGSIIDFNSVYFDGKYRIVSSMIIPSDINAEDYIDLLDCGSKYDFLEEITKRSLVETNASYDEDDRFVVLVASGGALEGNDLAIVAKDIAFGDDDGVSYEKNKTPLLPLSWYEEKELNVPYADELRHFAPIVAPDENEESDDVEENAEDKNDEESSPTDATGIKISQKEGMLYEGAKYKLSARLIPETLEGKGFIWESENDKVCSVDKNGQITAVGEGTTYITVKTADGKYSDKCKIYIRKAKESVEKIYVDADNDKIAVGEKLNLTVTFTPSTIKNQNCLWTSSNQNVAVVSSTGRVSAISPGRAVITAKSEEGGKTAQFVVFVEEKKLDVIPPKKDEEIVPPNKNGSSFETSERAEQKVGSDGREITLSMQSIEVMPGDEFKLRTSIYPVGDEGVKRYYESSNSSVASVDSNGIVSANRRGIATIKVETAHSDAYSTCVVYVDTEKRDDYVKVDGDADARITVKDQNGNKVTDSVFNIVCRVTENEVGSSFMPEAIKAQAVASYTYIMHNLEKGITPTVAMKSRASSTVEKCVDAVIGEAIYYGGDYINAVYHSVSAGKTLSAKDVWGSHIPYLVSVDSSWDKDQSKYYGKEIVIRERDMEDLIARYLGEQVFDRYKNPADWIYDTRTIGDTLYVDSVKVCGKNMSGREFREKLLRFKLPSQAFELDYRRGEFIFYCYGYGHGVGMSQWGAEYMAEDGYKHKDILEHYYKGARVR